jgi:hypothetical protein
MAEGRGVLVRITASHSAAGEQVTVYPGGTVFTIVAGRGHGHPWRSLPGSLAG